MKMFRDQEVGGQTSVLAQGAGDTQQTYFFCSAQKKTIGLVAIGQTLGGRYRIEEV